MKILVIEPSKHPYEKDIEHTLENLQSIVGGHITKPTLSLNGSAERGDKLPTALRTESKGSRLKLKFREFFTKDQTKWQTQNPPYNP